MLYCQDGEGGTIADQALSSFAHFPVSAPAPPHLWRTWVISFIPFRCYRILVDTGHKEKLYKEFILLHRTPHQWVMTPTHPRRHFQNLGIEKRKPEQSEFQLLQFFPSWQWVVVQLACCVSVFFHLLLSNVLLSWIQISPSITWWYIHHLLILHNASENAQGDVKAKVRESIGKKKIVKTVS